MKRELILFYYPKKNFLLKVKEINKFKKKYSKIIPYNNSYKKKLINFSYNLKILNDIKYNYNKLGIILDIKKIYEINYFLKNIRLKNKNGKIFVSPYFISGVILEEEFIFYELSKIYKIQFLRPELSFIKNRFILAKNIFKQPFILKKKTSFSKKNFGIFKLNYASSIQTFSERSSKKKINFHFYKIIIHILNFFFNFRFNKQPKKYALVILNNNNYLDSLSNNINLNYFTKLFLNKFKFELVFLLHPYSNPFNIFLKMVKNKNFFFTNKKIIFLHKPKNLVDIIKESKFIIHLSSSLSAQTIIFNKKILCLGKNIIYIRSLNKVIFKIKQNNLKFLDKKMNKNNILLSNKFLINILSNSVNSKGQFKLFLKKKDYSSNLRPYTINKYDKKIIQNLLNSI